jgi:hypothetical protein
MNQQQPPQQGPDEPDTSSAGDVLSRPGDRSGNATAYAELSALVLERQPLGAVLRRIADLAVKSIPDLDDASITLIRRGHPETVAFSGHLAITLDERQYEDGFGPCLDAARHGQTILVDAQQEKQENGIYAEFARQALRQGVRHVLSIGMPALQRGHEPVQLGRLQSFR